MYAERIFVMISSISAEFETPDHAETALRKIKEHSRGIYSATIRNSPSKPVRHRINPAAVNSHGFMTFTTGNYIDDASIPEPLLRCTANIYIVCERSCTEDIAAVLSALGGLKIQYSK